MPALQRTRRRYRASLGCYIELSFFFRAKTAIRRPQRRPLFRKGAFKALMNSSGARHPAGLMNRAQQQTLSMNTAFLLMAQYDGKAIIPIEQVCRDYFSHLNTTKLIQKISSGEIALPLVRIETSQKAARGVHLVDLAVYLDKRVAVARKEMFGSGD